jgi:CSLREA domain-containing protein
MPRRLLRTALFALAAAGYGLAGGWLALFGTRVEALSLTVDSTADAIDAAPGDGVCATATGVCTLRAAVQEANAIDGQDDITLPAGTYTVSISGAGEDGAATGDFDITDDLTIVGAGAGKTIIDAALLDRVFDVGETATVSLSRLTLRNGEAGTGDGGGIRNLGAVTLRDAVIEDSHADDGGGIVNGGTLVVESSVLRRNRASDVGGGINNEGGLTVRDSAVEENTAPFGGGGINNLLPATVSESLLAGNTATSGNGGGLHSLSDTTLSNVTVSGNRAARGGGLAVSAALTQTNVTITGNTAMLEGGGLFTDEGAVSSRNTVIAGNNGENCAGPGGYISGGHNLSDDASCLFIGGGDQEDVEPLLGPLADNGGPTRTHALMKGSPAIDGGDNIGCPPTDQRGVARPQGARCDIGAYEAGAVPVATPTPPVATSTFVPANTPTPLPPPPASTPTRSPTPRATVAVTPSVRAGDANCNGRVDSVDAALVLQRGARLVGLLPCEDAADANEDGLVNAVDAALILQFSAGLIDELPV